MLTTSISSPPDEGIGKVDSLEERVLELNQKYEDLLKENIRLADALREKDRQLDELRTKNERLKILLDNAPVGIVMTDERGNFLITNPETDATVRGNVTGTVFGPEGGYTLHYPDGSLIPEQELPMVQALRKGEIIKGFEMVVRMEDGEENFLLVNAAPVKNDKLEINGSVAVLHNITARRKAEVVQREILHENNRQRMFLEKLIQEVPIAITVLQGPEHRYVLVNPMQKYLTRGKGDIIGRPFAEVRTEYAEKVIPILDHVYQTGETYHDREVPLVIMRENNDKQTYLNVSYSPMFNEKGQVEGILVLAVETTEEVEYRRQVENERARLEAVLQALPVGVWISDNRGQLIGKNIEADRIWAGNAPLAESIDEYQQYDTWYTDHSGPLLPEDYPMVKVLQTGQPVEPVEFNIRRFDGTYGTILVSAAPIKDNDGLLVGSVGINVDISERKQVEEKLLQEQAFLRMVIDAAPNIVFVKDLEGRFVLANKQLAREYGKTVEEILGRTDADFNPNPEEVAHFQEVDREVIRSKKEKWIPEEEVTHADGEVHWYSTVKVPLINPDGTCNRLLGVATDISDRRAAENALKVYAEKLERSNIELEQFAFIASHDLQEPLRKVKAFGERLSKKLGDQIGDEEKDFLERMQAASQRMNEMIDALLELSRVNTRGRTFVPVDLNEVAEIVISDLESRIESAGATVTVEGLPLLEADPVQMQQLLQNLLTNSLKYRNPHIAPVINISGGLKEEKTRPVMAQIIVQDNGVGFDERYAERIFQPFERLVGRSEYEGSGMGLAICKKIVERHGGSITAQSKPGQGSTFIIKLPYRNR